MKFDRIKLLRTEIGITRDELADKLGVSSSALGNYERGEREPNAALIVKIAKYFGVTSDYILELSDNPKAAEEWPPAVLPICKDDIKAIKKATEDMLSYVRSQPDYGWILFDIFTEIITMLPTINGFVDTKLDELRKEYPNFHQFGTQAYLDFDGKSLFDTLADGIRATAELRRQLSETEKRAADFTGRLQKAKEEIYEMLGSICGKIQKLLMQEAFDAIQGKPGQRVPPTPEQIMLRNATPEQREAVDQAKAAVKTYLDLKAQQEQPPGE